MVIYKEIDIFRCPYCSREYKTLDESQTCAEECANIDSPEEDTKTIYICEYCKKEFEEEYKAESCEKLHRENRDELYSKVELKKASEHPNQLKLTKMG